MGGPAPSPQQHPETLQLELGRGSEVVYFPSCISHEASKLLFRELDQHPSWQKRPITLRDRRTGAHFEALEGRPTISFSEPAGTKYCYSGSWRVAEQFPECVLAAKERVEALLGDQLASWTQLTGKAGCFNYCLANKYENGLQSVGKHADDEPDILPRSPIATLSLGASRTFMLEAKDGGLGLAPHRLRLEAGSVLLMAGRTQEHFRHSIPRDRRVGGARISLTFRINR